MKIYTRTGDKGQTSLLGGSRVAKDDLRIEAYGTVDELNSHLGMLRDLCAPRYAGSIERIQSTLFGIGSRLSAGSEETAEKFDVPQLGEEGIKELEEAIDAFDRDLPPMRNFIIPGGHPAISQAHICRTVCRRAERLVVRLASQEAVPQVIVRYLNRLSDLLFIMARHLHKELAIPETPWRPRA